METGIRHHFAEAPSTKLTRAFRVDPRMRRVATGRNGEDGRS